MTKRTATLMAVFILFLQIFLLVTADWLYGSYAPIAKDWLVAYLLMEALVLGALLKGGISEIETGNMAGFVFFFIITTVVVIALRIPSGLFSSIEPVRTIVAIGLLYGLVKAFIEEVIFRGVLPKFIGGLKSQLVFGGFHASTLAVFVYPAQGFLGVLGVFALLSSLGVIWWYIFKRGGLLASTGSHLAWNLLAMGVMVL